MAQISVLIPQRDAGVPLPLNCPKSVWSWRISRLDHEVIVIDDASQPSVLAPLERPGPFAAAAASAQTFPRLWSECGIDGGIGRGHG